VLVHESGRARHRRRRPARLHRAGAAQRRRRRSDAGPGLAEHLEHLLRPVSAGDRGARSSPSSPPGSPSAASPGSPSRSRDPSPSASSPAWSSARPSASPAPPGWSARFTKADLDDRALWPDVTGLSLLAGIGFTVSLLIGELAFGAGPLRDEHVKVGVLAGSLLAAACAAVVLRARNRVYERLAAAEVRDHDCDGIPDAFDSTPSGQ
jgi:Na+:H+ antiporter, NhaA family